LKILNAVASGTSYSDPNQAIRACQDAVVARANRDGYQNVNFGSTALNTTRAGWIFGTITASRGPISDTFDFSCSMDSRGSSVRNLEYSRRQVVGLAACSGVPWGPPPQAEERRSAAGVRPGGRPGGAACRP
jgi:hypothetical protein